MGFPSVLLGSLGSFPVLSPVVVVAAVVPVPVAAVAPVPVAAVVPVPPPPPVVGSVTFPLQIAFAASSEAKLEGFDIAIHQKKFI